MKLRILTFAYLFAFCGIIYLASSGSTISFVIYDKVKIIPFYDKILHFILLGTMTYLVNTSFHSKRIKIGRYAVLLGSLIIGLAITFEEFSQLFLPHRNFEIMDLICNYAGIFTGTMLSKNKIPKLF